MIRRPTQQQSKLSTKSITQSKLHKKRETTKNRNRPEKEKKNTKKLAKNVNNIVIHSVRRVALMYAYVALTS